MSHKALGFSFNVEHPHRSRLPKQRKAFRRAVRRAGYSGRYVRGLTHHFYGLR